MRPGRPVRGVRPGRSWGPPLRRCGVRSGSRPRSGRGARPGTSSSSAAGCSGTSTTVPGRGCTSTPSTPSCRSARWHWPRRGAWAGWRTDTPCWPPSSSAPAWASASSCSCDASPCGPRLSATRRPARCRGASSSSPPPASSRCGCTRRWTRSTSMTSWRWRSGWRPSPWCSRGVRCGPVWPSPPRWTPSRGPFPWASCSWPWHRAVRASSRSGWPLRAWQPGGSRSSSPTPGPSVRSTTRSSTPPCPGCACCT
jgi:hypothetical protein